MPGSFAVRQPKASRPSIELPNEHGFWVMLCAVVLAAFAARPSVRSLVAAVVVVAGATVLASFMHKIIRRRPRLQLASAFTLASAGVPIELAAGTPLTQAAYDACAWAAVFGAFTLSVWACTARSSRVRRHQVRALTASAVLFPLIAAVGLTLRGHHGHALAALLGTGASSAFAIWRPGAKQMKAIGLTLAGVALVVALVLVVI